MRQVVLAAMWMVGIAACGTAPVPGIETAPIGQPWDDMALPIDAGEVKEASGTDLHILYRESSLDRTEMGAAWGKALEKGGWGEQTVRAMGPMVAVDYTREGAALQLIVASNGKRVDVTLELK